jgi:hypothetical protein
MAVPRVAQQAVEGRRRIHGHGVMRVTRVDRTRAAQ